MKNQLFSVNITHYSDIILLFIDITIYVHLQVETISLGKINIKVCE